MWLVEWYIARVSWVLIGECVFFAGLTFVAWWLRGKAYFFTEMGMYVAAILAFAAREEWAFALLSIAILAHIVGILRSLVIRDGE